MVAAAFYRGPDIYDGANKPPKKITDKKLAETQQKIVEEDKPKRDEVDKLLDDLG